jgi:hypothetical protein
MLTQFLQNCSRRRHRSSALLCLQLKRHAVLKLAYHTYATGPEVDVAWPYREQLLCTQAAPKGFRNGGEGKADAAHRERQAVSMNGNVKGKIAAASARTTALPAQRTPRGATRIRTPSDLAAHERQWPDRQSSGSHLPGTGSFMRSAASGAGGQRSAPVGSLALERLTLPVT